MTLDERAAAITAFLDRPDIALRFGLAVDAVRVGRSTEAARLTRALALAVVAATSESMAAAMLAVTAVVRITAFGRQPDGGAY